MNEQTASTGTIQLDTEIVTIAVGNTSPASMRKLVRRIDELPCPARVILTLTKDGAGVLFWTLQAMNGVER